MAFRGLGWIDCEECSGTGTDRAAPGAVCRTCDGFGRVIDEEFVSSERREEGSSWLHLLNGCA